MRNFLSRNSALRAATVEAGSAETEADETQVNAASHRSYAFSFAKRAGAAVNAAIEEMVEIGEKSKNAALTILTSLQSAYGDDMSSFPVPDSEGGNNPDKYTVPVTDTETGKTKNVQANFYTDYFAGTNEGLKWQASIEGIKSADNVNVPLDKVPAGWRDLRGDKLRIANELAKYRQRMTAGRNLIKRALKLHYQMADLSMYPAEFAVEFATYQHNGDTLLMQTSEPMVLADARSRKFETMGIGQFLKLDTAEAAKMPGGVNYDNLIKTLSKGTKDTTAKEASRIKSLEAFESTMAMVLHYIDPESEEAAKQRAALISAMRAGKKGADDLVLLTGDLIIAFDGIWKEIEADYNRLSAAKLKRSKATANGNGAQAAA